MFRTFRIPAILLALALAASVVSCRWIHVWCDDTTGLCWLNPQKDAYDRNDTGVVPSEAYAYCDELDVGGYDDWRLPTIDELRTLVSGFPGTEPGGQCGVVAGAETIDGASPACLGGPEFEGPARNGCYWKDRIWGTCDKPDPAVVGHPLETWAINPAADDPAHWVSYVTFDTGAASFNHSCSLGEVRCVRNDDGSAPPPCEVDGVPCHEYFPTKEHCEQDLTGVADKIELTIRVPSELPGQPEQLLAFLYKAEDGWFPPLAPPDGGTDYNQIVLPEIDLGEPLTVTIPATSYYREELLEGGYQLYVHLQMIESFPPIPIAGDFIWGEGQTAIEFPLDGDEHSNTVLPMDITLEPIGCPPETPYLCPDGTCAEDESLCSASECPEIPPDDEVLTCRYESTFIADNCADFPISDGWDAPGVETFCGGQLGADPATVVVTQADSCLVEKGGFSSSTRCAALEGNRRWWAYGTPEFVCNLFVGGDFEEGPFCSEY